MSLQLKQESVVAYNAEVGNLLPAQIARHKFRLLLLFLLGEGLAFGVIPISTRFSPDSLLIAQAAIAVVLLTIALFVRRAEGFARLWPVFSAFFVGALAVLVNLVFGDGVQELLGYRLDTASGVALAKLSQCTLRALPILLLLGLTARGREALYLGKGRLIQGLVVGGGAFAVFTLIAFFPLVGDGPALRQVLSWTPWILLFIIANAFEEELLFRGLFLKRYEPFLGQRLSNLATAIVFALIHVQVTYAADLLQFLLIVFPLGLAFAYLMQKSESIWGSVVFHAGADLLLIVPFFASL